VNSSYGMTRYFFTFLWVLFLALLPVALLIIATGVARRRGFGKWSRIIGYVIVGIPITYFTASVIVRPKYV
jgi:hypothetical protein